MAVLLAALVLQVSAGVAAAFCSRWPRLATALGAGGAVAGCVAGFGPTLGVLLGASSLELSLSWDAAHGAFQIGVDALSAFFLLPVLVLSAGAAIYGGNYLLAYREKKSLGVPWLFFNVFVAGMILVVIARTALLFLTAWEIMSLAAYFLLSFEQEKAEVRQAGWVYLIATHLGAAFIIPAFVLLGRQADSLEFAAILSMPAPSAASAGSIFVLALVGFGAKIGFVPFHVWLPEAHPAAPSHVSALMSSVMIKMGLYGLLRVLTFLGMPAPWWGVLLAALGLLTALVGIGLSLQQRDIKRVLAYSSIENMGLIGLSLGVGLWGWAIDAPAVAVLGMTAVLLHVWHHALMKGLMFFAAGSVLHGTGTRDMEQLGGLMHRMPWTGFAFMSGALAIAALPPLNGFVSKWLMYVSLLQTANAPGIHGNLLALFAIGLLALIGGLTAITFVRLAGITLLGASRSDAARRAHEASPWMIAPIYVLLILCIITAVIPQFVVLLLTNVLEQMLSGEAAGTWSELAATDAPIYIVGNLNAWLLVLAGGGTILFLAWARRSLRAEGPTWGCGYVRPTERMQYTGRSFSEMMADHLLPRFLRPRTKCQAPRGLFPAQGDFKSESPDPFRTKGYEPFFRRWARRFVRLRILQQGKINIYLIYVVLTVVVALAWVSLRTWWAAS